MIRELDRQDIEQLFSLMQSTYSNHSFLEKGREGYEAELTEGKYVSIGYFGGDEKLLAHAGYKDCGSFAIINALIVHPSLRGAGIGRAIFNKRLEHVESSGRFDYVVGFSMMQHLWSQMLYSDAFKPIGLEVGYDDIYHDSDSVLNRGEDGNGELVLCKRLTSESVNATVELGSEHRNAARAILESIGMVVDFIDPNTIKEQEVNFLGFTPDANTFLSPAFVETGKSFDFTKLLTSNYERAKFVNSIQADYA